MKFSKNTLKNKVLKSRKGSHLIQISLETCFYIEKHYRESLTVIIIQTEILTIEQAFSHSFLHIKFTLQWHRSVLIPLVKPISGTNEMKRRDCGSFPFECCGISQNIRYFVAVSNGVFQGFQQD